MTGGLDDRHTGITSFYPNKLPIVIQIVSKELTRLEGCITEGTLGRHRSADRSSNNAIPNDLIVFITLYNLGMYSMPSFLARCAFPVLNFLFLYQASAW